MKAQHIRPGIQQQRVARRQTRRRGPVAKSTERVSHRQRPGAAPREHDVFWLMILVGALLTVGFVLGLRSQINAHQLNRAEEKLRDRLDRYAGQQKYLALEQKRALSLPANERNVKEAGLVQMKLDVQNALAKMPDAEAVKGKFGVIRQAEIMTNRNTASKRDKSLTAQLPEVKKEKSGRRQLAQRSGRRTVQKIAHYSRRR